MKNKKGFTLVELMAVMVILAVVSLVSIPVIFSVTENAREEAKKTSVLSYANAIKTSYAEGMLSESDKSLEEIANSMMKGETVACEKVKYDENRFGSILYGCNVDNKGNYCYFEGNVYDGESDECQSVLSVIDTGSLNYNKPIIEVVAQTPSGTEYAQSRTFKVSYPSLKIVEEHYFIKANKYLQINNIVANCGVNEKPSDCRSEKVTTIEPNVWYEVSGEFNFTVTQNTIVQAVIGNLDEYGFTTSYNENKIDTTAADAVIASVSTTSNKAIVYPNCSDLESGITKIEYSKDNGANYQESNIFNNLVSNTNYTFKIRCTNGSGMVTESEPTKNISTKEIIKPIIKQISQKPTDTNTYPTYAQERVIRVTYSGQNVENPEYYLKSNISVTVGTGIVESVCGNATNPSSCTTSNVTTLSAGYWYKVSTTQVDVKYVKNGALYARTADTTGNKADASTYSVVNIDTSAPTTSIAVGTMYTDRTTITATCNDFESGITKYEFSSDNGSTWVDNGTVRAYTFVGLKQNTSYTFVVRCTNGSALTKTASSTGKTETIPNPTISQYSQKPTDTNTYPTYAQERIIRITYYGTNVQGVKYYYSLNGSTWTEVTDTTKDVTFTVNGKLYAKTVDASGNTATASTYSVVNIDTTVPTVSATTSAKTDRVTVTATCSDTESGIVKYEYSKDNGATWVANGTTNTYTFTGLTQNTSYAFSVRCTNGAALTKTANSSKTTESVKAPTIAQASQIPTDKSTYPTYAQERVLKITYYDTNIVNPKYYYSLDGTTWTEVTSTTKNITFNSNGKLYAKTVDPAGNVASASTYSVANMDTTAPSASITFGTVRADRVTVTATCSDDISGIVKYEYSKDNGATWVANGKTSTYTFSGLKQGTSYTFGVRCTNGAALTKTATASKSTVSIPKPTIAQTSQTPNDSDYVTKRVATITYSSTGVESPEYYFKSSSTATVASGVVTHSCGTGTTPSTCSTSSVTTLVANTWYKTSSTKPAVTYTQNGTLYAMTMDASDNSTSAVTWTASNIDTTEPSVSIAVSGIKTDRATVTATCSDTESGITKYEFSSDNGSTWIANGTSANYTFTGLKQNTSYTFVTRCTNGSGLTKTASSTKSTIGVVAPTIAQVSQNPSGEWAQSRVIRITYSSDNVTNPKYYYSLDGSTWVVVTTTTKDITFNANGKLYAKTVDDAGNMASASTYTVTNIDTTAPSASIATTAKTDRVTVTATCSDSESGIAKYEFSKDNGSTWTDKGTTNSYTFTGLTQNTSYTFAIRCTNGSGVTKTASSSKTTASIPKPTIAQASQNPTGTTYAQSRVIKITYSGTNVQSPEYYFKSTVSATVASGVVTHACGTDTNPGTCSASSVTTLVANTWYKTSSTTPSVTYTSNGALYAQTMDSKDNRAEATTFSVANMDTTAPSASVALSAKTDRITLTATCSDSESGITKYEFSKDNGSTWVDKGTTKSYTFTGLTQNTTYEFLVRCTNGSGLTKTTDGSTTTKSIPKPTIAQASQTPSSGDFAQSRVIKITYSGTNVQSPEYYFKSTVSATVASGVITHSCGTSTNPGTCSEASVTVLEANTWYKTSSTTPSITYISNGALYAQTMDPKDNRASATTYSVANIDTSSPTLTLTTATTTTNSITIPFNTSAGTSGISGTTCIYGTSTSYGNNGTISGNSCVITGLTANTKYYYQLTTTNGSGLTDSKTGSATTKSVPNPSIAYTNTPSTAANGYLKSQVLKVTYSTSNITSPQYFVKTTRTGTSSVAVTQSCRTGTNPGTCSSITSTTSLAANTWYKVSGNVNVTYTAAASATGTLYAMTYDGNNYSGSVTGTISKIDATAPSLALSTVSTTTNSITVPFSASDDESGIKSTTCVYGTSTSYGSNGTISGTNCVISGLTQGTTYYYKVTTTNGVGTSTSKTGSTAAKSITKPTIAYENTPTEAVNGYLTKQVLKVTYSSAGVTSPQYFVKTTRAGVSSLSVTQSCGTSTNPGTCSSITGTTSLAANTWYKVSGNVNVTYTEYATSTGTLYALTYDGNNYSASATGTISKITKGVTYTVNHYQMDTDMTNYTLYETEILSGTANYTSTPAVKTYTGFTSPATQTVTVAADGSTVVEYRYARKQIVVTFHRNTSSSDTTTATQTFTYGVSGQKFTNKSWTKSGSDQIGWATTASGKFKYTITNSVSDSWINSNSPTDDLYAVWIVKPTITFANTPSTAVNGYYKSQVATVTYNATNLATPTYYIKTTRAGTSSVGVTSSCGTSTDPETCSTITSTTALAANTWYQVSGTTIKVTYNTTATSTGTLYAYAYDGTKKGATATATISKIDASAPSLTLGTTTTKTNSLTVPFTASDGESGIASTTCVYGTSTSYGSNGTISGTNCVISGLTANTTYYYKVTTTNGLGTTKEVTGSAKTASMVAPTIAYTNTPTTAANGYLKSQVIKVTYSASNITSPQHFVKSSRAGTSSVAVTASCGTSTNPGTCSTITSTTSLAANTWYKVSGNVNVTYNTTATSTGTLYAITYDGTNYTTSSTGTISKIDASAPSLTIGTVVSTTNSITIPFTASDGESGISSTTCVYGTSTSYGSNGTINGTNCILSNLTQGTTYYYKVTTTNGVTTATAKTGSKATAAITNPTVAYTNTPSTAANGYLKSQVLKVTYSSSGITSPQYFVKSSRAGTSSVAVTSSCGTGTNPGTCSSITSTTSLAANTWYKVSGNVNVTYSAASSATGTLYAMTYDGNNYSGSVTGTISKIDTSAPSLTIGTVTSKTNNLTIPFTASDSESGISSTTCVYGTSTSYGSNGTISGTNCVITGLTQGTTYYYKVTTKNGVTLTKDATGSTKTASITNPSVTYTNTPSTAANGYLKTQVLKVTYSSSNISSPQYFVKVTRAGTSSVAVTSSCGTGTNPGTCSSITSTTTLSANTWYKVSGNVNVTYSAASSATGTLYAMTYDGNNYSGSVTGTISKIDATAPSLTIGTITSKTNNLTIPFTASDSESGISSTTCVYGTSTSYGSNGTISGTNCVITGLTQGTTYYYKVTTKNGVTLTKDATGSTKTASITNPSVAYTNTPSTAANGYLKTQVLKVTYSSSNISSPQYFVKTTRAGTSSVSVTSYCGTGTSPTPASCTTVTSTTALEANKWYKVSGNVNVTYSAAASATGTLYAMTYDGNNYSGSATGTISKIDATAPSLALSTVSTTTNSITVPFSASDDESGIKSTTCVYGTSTSYGSNGTISGTNCVISGLTQGTTYYYKVTTTNGVGTSTSKTGSTAAKAITKPTIAYENTPTEAVNGYLTKQVLKVTYSSTGITSPQYFVKTSRAGTSSVAVTQSCGTGTNPGTCSSITSTTSLAANTWYKVSGNVNVTYTAYATSTGTLYAVTYDGTTYSTATTGTISKITKSVSYTVKHYQMNTDMTNYTLYATETLTGTANYTATPAVKTYTGFTSPAAQTVTVAADGSTVVEYKYARKQVVATFYRNTSSSDTTTATQTFTYGVSSQKFTNKSWTKSGSTQIGWTTTASGKYTYAITNGVADSWINSNSPSTKLYAVWVVNPTITFTNTPSTAVNGYYKSQVAAVTFNGTNLTTPTYYIKTTRAGTSSVGVTSSCGTSTDPGTCSTITSTTSLAANTWYKITGTTVNVTYNATATSTATLYAYTYDGTTKRVTTTATISKIDASAPSLTLGTVASSTNSITIPFTASDAQSGLSSTTCVYGTSTSYGSNGTISGTNCVISGLTQNTTYYYKVTSTDKLGLTTTKTGSTKTATITNPKITITTTPSSAASGYVKSVVASITYTGTNITSPQYFVKTTRAATSSVGVTSSCGTSTNPGTCSTITSTTSLAANTWYKVSGNVNITYSAAASATATLYAMTYDGKNYSGSVTGTISKIDASAPSLTLGTVTSTSSVITVPFTASDGESGIKSTTCVYGTSTSYGSNGTISGTNCVISGLTKGTTYYYKVTTTNGVGTATAKTGSKATPSPTNPTIAQASETVASGYTWATQRVIKITYSATNASSPTYYFKSTVAATVASGVITQSCGTSTNPGTCSTSSVTTLAANTWYRTTSTTPSITYTANGTLYAVTKDGNNLSGTTSYSVAQTSNGTPSAPTITGGSTTWSASAKTISVSTASTEASGIKNYQYCISTSTSSCNGTWTNTATSTTSQSISTNGTRYIYFRAIANNGKTSSVSAYQTTKIDTAVPTVTVSVSGKNATFTIKDNISAVGYGVNQSSTTQPTYTTFTGTTSTSKTWTASAAGTYYVWVKDQAGNVNKASFTIAATAFCSYSAGQTWEYAYTGGVQTFTVPCAGTYKLEVYGAQGGSVPEYAGTNGIGGRGGYASGYATLSKDSNLYVVVGGQGINGSPSVSQTNTGGYNGGGYGISNKITGGTNYYGGSGGGATHIGTFNSILSSHGSTTGLYIVAGGGGGGAGQYGWNNSGAGISNTVTGGSGGGLTGSSGNANDANYDGGGGTQTSGGTNKPSNKSSGFSGFGKGGDSYHAGGGGGLYGGGSGYALGGGGGGSSYIGGVTNGTTLMGAREGNGYAKITYMGGENYQIPSTCETSVTMSSFSQGGNTSVGTNVGSTNTTVVSNIDMSKYKSITFEYTASACQNHKNGTVNVVITCGGSSYTLVSRYSPSTEQSSAKDRTTTYKAGTTINFASTSGTGTCTVTTTGSGNVCGASATFTNAKLNCR